MASNKSGKIRGGQLCELHVTLGDGSFGVPFVQMHCRQLPDSCGSTEPTAYDVPILVQMKYDYDCLIFTCEQYCKYKC